MSNEGSFNLWWIRATASGVLSHRRCHAGTPAGVPVSAATSVTVAP
jgi:hypothetical protein